MDHKLLNTTLFLWPCFSTIFLFLFILMCACMYEHTAEANTICALPENSPDLILTIFFLFSCFLYYFPHWRLWLLIIFHRLSWASTFPFFFIIILIIVICYNEHTQQCNMTYLIWKWRVCFLHNLFHSMVSLPHVKSPPGSLKYQNPLPWNCPKISWCQNALRTSKHFCLQHRSRVN